MVSTSLPSSAPYAAAQADLGSLNGTILNARVISREGRQRSDPHTLADQDVLQLGTNTQIRVHCHPSPHRSQPTTGVPAALRPA